MARKIVFLDRGTIAPGIDIRKPGFVHVWQEFGQSAGDQVTERLHGADIAITNKVSLKEQHFAALPELEFVAVAATGHDVIDIDAADRHGVVVSNIRAYAGNTVPEHTFALILALRRNLIQYRKDVLGGRWQQSAKFCFFNEPIRELAGSTLGLIGCGSIGRAVGRIGLAFGMRVVYLDEHIRTLPAATETLPFNDFLSVSDVVSCHCPLTDATRGLIDRQAFERMKPTAILINTARGGIVDESDLAEAVESGRIAGAGIDVVAEEPPPRTDRLMRLANRANFLLTPHVAWASMEAMQRLADQLIDIIEAFERGEARNIVGRGSVERHG